MHPVDLYCERIAPGLLGEPLNAASNVAFFVAAWMLWRFAGESRFLSARAWLLIAMIAVIGAGSTLFHLFASEETRSLDLLPILVFELLFLWFYARMVIRIAAPLAAVLAALLVALSLYGRAHPEPFNGSLVYAPALLALLGLAAYRFNMRVNGRYDLVLAFGLFVASLVFRTIDQAACEWTRVGTHFIWHILNAAVLYLCVRGWLRGSQLQSAPKAISGDRC